MAKTAKAVAKHHTKKTNDPTESMIIQAGVIFIIVSAIAIFGYVMSVYSVLK